MNEDSTSKEDLLEELGGLRKQIAQLEARLKDSDEIFRQSDRSFREWAELLPQSLFEFDLDGTFTYANRQGFRSFGYEQRDIETGTNVLQLVIAEDQQKALKNIAMILGGQLPEEVEYTALRKDGTTFPAIIHSGPVLRDGNVAGLRGICIDITDRKQFEDALRQSEEKFRDLVEKAGIAILTQDQAGGFEYFNQKFLDLLGHSAEQMARLTIEDIVHEQDAGTVTRHTERLLRGEEVPSVYKCRAVTRDGRTLFLEVYVTPIVEGSKIVGTRSYVWDVTQSELLKQELQQHRDRLEDMVAERTEELSETMVRLKEEVSERKRAEVEIRSVSRFPDEDPSPVMRVSNEKRLLYANQASSFVLSEWGCAIGDPIPGDVGRAVEEALASGKERIVEMDCAGRFLSFMVAPIAGEGYVNLYGRDMTEHRRIEERFRSLQKMEAIGTLAGGVAHDFNNLLTTILGQADLALADLDPGHPAVDQLREVCEASNKASSLTRQLLLFSRKQPMETKPVDINGTVGNLLKMIKRVIGEDVRVQVELEPELWAVEADEGNIEQVIVNLAVNARDAMPHGGTLTIKTENAFVTEGFLTQDVQVPRPEHVRISLTDTGVGMDEETINHIFEPFFTTKEVGKGTGLGLSVVYGIVRKHKGWVDVESRPGRGSTFVVSLPASPPTKLEASETSQPLEVYRGKGEAILLVEDDPNVRSLVVAALRSYGYEVFEAASYNEAVEVYGKREGDFQLILSDVVLPDQSGIDLVELLLSRRPDHKVLLCSGYTDEKSQWRRIKERNFNFLEKPFNVAGLLRSVQEAIEG